MPRATPIQTNFSSGQLSPLVQGRVDFDAYKHGLGLCRNWITTLQGALIRRPGFEFIAGFNGDVTVRLIPFVFSPTQTYMLLFSGGFIYFCTQENLILSGGIAYGIAMPYADADLFDIRYTQSGDVLYLVHPSYAPQALSRLSDTNWTLAPLAFTNGPFFPQNTSNTTLTMGASTGTTSCIASTGIFAATDVGRWIAANPSGSQWGYAQITGFTSSVHVTIKVSTGFPFGGSFATATTEWMLGLFTDTPQTGGPSTGNWPSFACFHQGRLFFFNTPSDPIRADGSTSQKYLDFTPCPANGDPTDSNALNFEILSNELDPIRWAVSNQQGLQMGSFGGEWLATGTAGTSGTAISPLSIDVVRQSSFGSSAVAPVPVGRATLYLQRAGLKIREMYYQYILQGFDSQDITVLSEDITLSGIKEMAFQEEPIPILWAVRNDGILIGCTYEHDIQQLRVGWHEHQIGGFSTANGDPAVVESVAVIPTITQQPFSNQAQDEVWIVVKRYVNGRTVHYVEVMAPSYLPYNFAASKYTAFYLDSWVYSQINVATNVVATAYGHSGYYIANATQTDPCVITIDPPLYTSVPVDTELSIDGVYGMTELNGKSYLASVIQSFAITGVTRANPAVVTAPGHNFTNGQKVVINGVGGMIALNGSVYTVAGAAANTFQLQGVNSSAFGTYVSGGTVNGPNISLQDFNFANIDATNYGKFQLGPQTVPGLSATGIMFLKQNPVGPFTALKGETVDVLGDGGVQSGTIDGSGNLTLASAVGYYVVGYAYNSDLQCLRFDAGAADGTRMGKSVRSHRAGLLVSHTLDLQVGYDGFGTQPNGDPCLHIPDEMKRQGWQTTGFGPPLYSGIVTFNTEANSNLDNLICIRAAGPFPATIQAIFPMMETQDRS